MTSWITVRPRSRALLALVSTASIALVLAARANAAGTTINVNSATARGRPAIRERGARRRPLRDRGRHCRLLFHDQGSQPSHPQSMGRGRYHDHRIGRDLYEARPAPSHRSSRDYLPPRRRTDRRLPHLHRSRTRPRIEREPTYQHRSPRPAAATGRGIRRALAVVAGAASYERLARVKADYDPTNFLRLHDNVEPPA